MMLPKKSRNRLPIVAFIAILHFAKVVRAITDPKANTTKSPIKREAPLPWYLEPPNSSSRTISDPELDYIIQDIFGPLNTTSSSSKIHNSGQNASFEAVLLKVFGLPPSNDSSINNTFGDKQTAAVENIDGDNHNVDEGVPTNSKITHPKAKTTKTPIQREAASSWYSKPPSSTSKTITDTDVDSIMQDVFVPLNTTTSSPKIQNSGQNASFDSLLLKLFGPPPSIESSINNTFGSIPPTAVENLYNGENDNTYKGVPTNNKITHPQANITIPPIQREAALQWHLEHPNSILITITDTGVDSIIQDVFGPLNTISSPKIQNSGQNASFDSLLLEVSGPPSSNESSMNNIYDSIGNNCKDQRKLFRRKLKSLLKERSNILRTELRREKKKLLKLCDEEIMESLLRKKSNKSAFKAPRRKHVAQNSLVKPKKN